MSAPSIGPETGASAPTARGLHPRVHTAPRLMEQPTIHTLTFQGGPEECASHEDTSIFVYLAVIFLILNE